MCRWNHQLFSSLNGLWSRANGRKSDADRKRLGGELYGYQQRKRNAGGPLPGISRISGDRSCNPNSRGKRQSIFRSLRARKWLYTKSGASGR